MRAAYTLDSVGLTIHKRLMMVDGLTSVANRRHFDQHLAQEWQRLLREYSPTVKDLQLPHAESLIGQFVLLSLGVATIVPTADSSPSTLIESADKEVVSSKGGRSRSSHGWICSGTSIN